MTPESEPLAQAIARYEALLAKNPKHVESLHHLALLYAKAQDGNAALHLLQQTLRLAPCDPNLYNSMGNLLRQCGDYPNAIEAYLKAIALEPNYVQAHCNVAGVFALQQDFSKALYHYREALHLAPDYTDAHYHLGLLCLKHQRLKEACIQFQNVVELCPSHTAAWFYIGVIHLHESHLLKAENAFQSVLSLDKTHAQAWSNLGVIALKRDQGQRAVDYFTQALAYDPSLTEAKSNLAASFMHYDRFENALTYYRELRRNEPHHIEYLYNSGVAEMALGHLEEATTLFEALLTQQPEHFAALNNLAAIALRLDHREKAKQLLQRALKANPHDAASQHMQNALEGWHSEAKTSHEYAQNLFNNYALYYDKHMNDVLKYTLPEHVKALCETHGLTALNQVLDLGCGTGLIGEVLRPWCQTLVGVDIAKKMIERATAKHCYDSLHQSNILDYLKTDTASYDLITLMDVVPYFGELDALIHGLSQHLNPNGYALLSTEISENSPWRLQINGRFCHHKTYVEALCLQHGLDIKAIERCVARQQEHLDVPEHLFVICRAQVANAPAH